MRKPLLVIIVIVALAVGGWFLFGRGGSKEVGEVSAPSGTGVETPSEESFTGKLKDALSLGASMKCTWETDESNFGTAYIKGAKVYSDVTYADQRAYSIMVDNCVYSWQEGKTEGLKICFEPEEVEEAAGEAPSAEGFFREQPDIDYSCVTAVVSDAKFRPPTHITFVDPEEMMRQLMPTP